VRQSFVGPRSAKHAPKRGSCEDFCREAVEKGTISHAVVERALQMAHVPNSSTRKNVIPKGQESIRGAIVGLFVYADMVNVSSFTRCFPWLARLLAAFCRKAQPNFNFTSIQLNVNYAARPHVDGNNLGVSFITGLGNYTGGNLWMHKDDGNKAHTLEETLKRTAMYQKGETFMGADVSIRNRWVEFDGNRLHFARPFRGTRFSLVYFTCDRYADSKLAVREELKDLGFPFQWESVKLQKMLVTKRVERDRVCKLFYKERNSLHLGVVPHLRDDDCVWYEKENPKRNGCDAWKRYRKYSRARTLGEAVKLGAWAIDVIFDYNHGWLHVEGLCTRPTDWDFEVKDGAGTGLSHGDADPSSTAIDEGDGKIVKVRIGEMNSSHKGFDVQRKSLAMLAARVSKLSRTPEAKWVTESSPTAAVPLAALRALLHWATTGRLFCKRGRHKEAISAALVAWGEHRLAARVAAEGMQDTAAAVHRQEPRAVPATSGHVQSGKRKRSPPVIRMKLKPKAARQKKSGRKKLAGHPQKEGEMIRFEQKNPKRSSEPPYERYEKYKKAKTVQQALHLGALRADIRWDFKMGFLKRLRK